MTAGTQLTPQLLAAARHSSEAMDTVLRLTEPMVMGMAQDLPIEDAEDWAQEGRLAVVRAVMGFDAQRGVRFGTYCRTCLRHAWRAYSRRLHAKDYCAEDAQATVVDTAMGPEDKVLHEDWLAEQRTLMRDKLSPLEYKVWRLRVDGCSYAEIAQLLATDGQPPNIKQVNNALVRVRAKLRK